MEPGEDVFQGPAMAPPAGFRGDALAAPGSGEDVRHVSGYAPFLGFCARHDVLPRELAADPGRLLEFLRVVGPELDDDAAVSTAAAVFTGNVIAGLRPDLHWIAIEGAAPMVGNAERQVEIPRLIEGLRSADDESVRGFAAGLRDWAQEGVEEDPPVVYPQPVPPAAGQPRYVRPALPAAVYYFPDGQPIPYGRRWGALGPAPDSYSVLSHPGRFAGLHRIARALIDHLCAVYDADADEDLGHAAELLTETGNAVHAVHLRPGSAGAAPLTIVFTNFPGVMVHAGVLHDFPFPACGCDACDETAGTEADRLERLVLAVAAGGYSERYPVGRRRWAEYALTAVDGSGAESGRGEPGPLAAARLLEAELRLRGVPQGWAPWPLRR